MSTKLERSNDFTSKIKSDLKSGLTVEKPSTKISGCLYCQYAENCPRTRHLSCMAHNRVNKDSIYYSAK